MRVAEQQRAQATPWHVRPAEEVAAELGVQVPHGLSHDDAARRLATEGPNELEERKRRSPLVVVLGQFTDLMVLVLIAAAIVSGIVGEPEDTVAIVVILLVNGAIGATQELRAERALEALGRMAAPRARVRRGGGWTTVAARELVRGDVVALEAGDVVSADARLVETADLRVDEAALTGESLPVEKAVEPLEEHDLPIGDRVNLAHRGTAVTSGRGTGLVFATGMRTELGRVAGLLQSADAGRTPLQRRLARFGRALAIGVLVICAGVFALGVARGEEPTLMFLTAVSLAVAAIPEALPAVVTVALALGARRMAKRNALVRKLAAVETLGSVTVVCTDKTGTLTQNRMSVDVAVAAGEERAGLGGADGEPWRALARAAALNNDATFETGDPTEVALLEAARDAGLDVDELRRSTPRAAEIAFVVERRRMTTVHPEPGGGVVAYTKGAPEVVLERCTAALGPEGEMPLDADEVLETVARLAGEGGRLLAFAQRRFDAEPADRDELDKELTFLGVLGLVDPLRPEAKDAVQQCRAAGIRPVMITGDHPRTALAIARQLGLAESDDEVVTGVALERGDVDLHAVRVFARVSPEQKLAIVKALQDAGEYVAMTGDGVNDAPALKQAEIGVAMGRGGTDVAREAADMVLLDDNFATVVAAVREGRRVYDNVRKFVRYTMTSNSGEIWTLTIAPLLGLPIPLLPVQILWINLVTDGLPGLALGVEPAERGVMERKPRPPNESIFAHGLGRHVVWVGLTIAGLSIGAQAWFHGRGAESWQTITFTVLTFSQLAHALVVRSERRSIFTLGLRTNLPLVGAIVLTLLLQLAVIYAPFLQSVFETTALGAGELAACLLLPLVVIAACEIEKAIGRARAAPG